MTKEMMKEYETYEVYVIDEKGGFIIAGPVSLKLAMEIVEKNNFESRWEVGRYWKNTGSFYVWTTNKANTDKYGCIDIDTLEEIPGVVYG